MIDTRSPGWQLVLAASAPFRSKLLLACLFAVVASVTEPALPYFLQPLLDEGFNANRSFPIWWVPAVIMGLFIVRGAASFTAQYGFAWVAQRTIERLREQLFTRLQGAPASAFRQYPASQLINIVIFEIQTAVGGLSSALFVVVKDSLSLVGLLGLLFYLNWQLALVAALVFPAVGVIIRTIGKAIKRLQARQQRSIDALAYAVEENALGHRVVRVQNAQASESERFAKLLRNTRRFFLRTEATAASGTPITQVIAAMGVSVVLTLALAQSTTNGTTVGTFTSFITAMLMLLGPFKALAGVSQTLARASVSLDRAAALLNLPSEQNPEQTSATDQAPKRSDAPRSPAIEFKAVNTCYTLTTGEIISVLKDVSLQIGAGQTLALVGASGAGKTTLANVLPGFVEVSGGSVQIDGTELRDWDLNALRSSMALVSQEVVLFNDSLAANVAFGQPRDDARVWQALEDAYLADFARAQSTQLDAPVGHNGNLLSGGQRQRLAIARALYKNAPILILDEATSALDSESERQVQQAIDRLKRNRTVLVIAHRLSTIENADRIALLDQGRVIELGTHAELIAAGGAYSRLRALQFGEPAP